MSESERGIRLRSSAHTNAGQVRENNEDNVHLWAEENFVVAIVADGMGGAAAGEEASRLAVEVIHDLLYNDNDFNASGSEPPDPQSEISTDKLREAVDQANLVIIDRAADNAEFKGMGTTVTMAFVSGSQAALAHVGDSRAYRVDGETGIIEQITLDHSFVQALLTAGHITEEEAEEHPMRNVLYRALGQDEDMDVDIYLADLHVSDRLVLCSDGLTRHVRADEIAEIALAHDDPNAISEHLIDLANARGGEDNVSVIVIVAEEDVSAVYEAADSAGEEFANTEPMLPHGEDSYYTHDGENGGSFQNRLDWSTSPPPSTWPGSTREGSHRFEQRGALQRGLVRRNGLSPVDNGQDYERTAPLSGHPIAAEGRDSRRPRQ